MDGWVHPNAGPSSPFYPSPYKGTPSDFSFEAGSAWQERYDYVTTTEHSVSQFCKSLSGEIKHQRSQLKVAFEAVSFSALISGTVVPSELDQILATFGLSPVSYWTQGDSRRR